MSVQTTVRTGAWRWGLLFGIIVGVLTNVTTLLGFLLPGPSGLVSNLISIASFGVSLFLCGCAGCIAARKSRSPYVGNSAGLYAGLVSAIIVWPITLLLLYINSATVRQWTFLFTISVGCTLAIYVLLALAAGVVGGKLAQRGLARTGVNSVR